MIAMTVGFDSVGDEIILSSHCGENGPADAIVSMIPGDRMNDDGAVEGVLLAFYRNGRGRRKSVHPPLMQDLMQE